MLNERDGASMIEELDEHNLVGGNRHGDGQTKIEVHAELKENIYSELCSMIEGN